MVSRALVCSEENLQLVADSTLKESFELHLLDTTLAPACTCDGKRMLQVPPPDFIWQPTYAYGNCPHNAISALVGRVGMSVPKTNETVLAMANPIISHLARKVGVVVPLSYDQVISAYTGSKKKRYSDAYESLVSNGRVPNPGLQMFVKTETNIFNPTKPKPAARPIQYHDYGFALELARYVKPIEHQLYELADDEIFGVGKTFFKNLNSRQRGTELRKKWESFRNPVAYLWDAHRYDAHKSLEVMVGWEHAFYLKLIKSRRFAKMLAKLCKTRGEFKYKREKLIKYTVLATQVSGGMNTALGNCLVMCIIMAIIYTKLGVPWTLACDGDDSVVITEGLVDTKLPIELAKEMGFVLKLDKVCTEFESIDFCQCNPVNVDKQWTMVRNPHRSIVKALSNPKYRDVNSLAKKLRTVAQGELSLNVGVPLLQTFFARLQQEGTSRMSKRSLSRNGGWDGEILTEYRYGRELTKKWTEMGTREISMETRLSFAKAFDISPSDQILLERRLAKWVLPRSLKPEMAEGLDVHTWSWPIRMPEASSPYAMMGSTATSA